MRLHSKIHDAAILLVDDDPESLTLLSALLKKDGYHNVTVSLDPLQTFELHHRHQFDAILCDIHMPTMDGFEVLTTLLHSFAEEFLPFIALSVDNSSDLRNLALASGARDYLVKPFDNTEVLFRLKNLLETTYLHKELAAHNEQLESLVQQRTQQLYNAQIKLIESLGRAAEYRDNETGTHVMRISQTTAILGKALGLSTEELELLSNASPMHDVGKIAIPDNVLLKPGKLDEAEWTTMKTHAALGATILLGQENDSPLLQSAAEIALHHHERWDGSGYPNGLAGEDIPLFARITSVCDVFDALTSRRPYKEPWSVQRALAYVNEQSGHAFDPEIASTFCGIVDKIMAVRENYPDPPKGYHDTAYYRGTFVSH